jgi:hypothetical protein
MVADDATYWVQRGDCVEMVFVSNIPKQEQEWVTWVEKQNIKLHVQMSMLVSMGEEGEACVNRLIEMCMENAHTMDASFFDAYRIASNGKMHFYDGRGWCMKQQDYERMRQSKRSMQAEVERAWQRRMRLATEIDMAHDILSLSERIAPFQICEPLESGAVVYSLRRTGYMETGDSPMLLQFTALFDWYDLKVLEDKEAETLMEIDTQTHALHQMEVVLERQRVLLGIPEGKKRGRAAAM